MSLLSGVDHPPVLPMSLAGLVKAACARAAGAAMVLAAAVGWASLVTWSSGDPSLTHSTAGATRNLLGPAGATFSDLALQLLGFAAAFALLAPLVWGAELILNYKVPRFRWKAGLLPFAVVALAGGCSALPPVAAWPLRHGFGGILGDVVANFAAGVCATLVPIKPSAVSGMLLLAGGLAALAYSLGLRLRDLGSLAEWTAPARAGPALSAWRADFGAAFRRGSRVEPHLPYWRADAGSLPNMETPLREHEPRPPGRTPSTARHHTRDDRFEPYEDGEEPGTRGSEFDVVTDQTSRALARRFAPAGGQVRDTASQVDAGLLPEPERGRDERPSLALLQRPPPPRRASDHAHAVLRGNARLLQDTLADLGVVGQVRGRQAGPVVTLFEFEPARATNPARVIGLADDIARCMGASGVRIAALPRPNTIGIELPNVHREGVFLRELMETDAFRSSPAALPLALGKGAASEPVVLDLAQLPHLLIAGAAGSGKSAAINALVLSLLIKLTPNECRLLMIDPKMLELSSYGGIPHLLGPVVSDAYQAVAALEWVVAEMEDRCERMASVGVRNIVAFNTRVRGRTKGDYARPSRGKAAFGGAENHALAPMPYMVVVIDEFADLMVVAGKDTESALGRLAPMARAAGIHLILATQRPSADIVTGSLKAIFPARIGFKLASKADSRSILNEPGAEQLAGRGDMLFAAGSVPPSRVQGAFVAEEDVQAVAQFLRGQRPREVPRVAAA